MLESIPGSPENVLGFSAKGTVTAHDYESVIIPAVEAQFARQKKVRFLYHLGEEFTGWEKMAVVSDVAWIRLAIEAFGLALPGRVRVFHDSELADAKRWVAE